MRRNPAVLLLSISILAGAVPAALAEPARAPQGGEVARLERVEPGAEGWCPSGEALDAYLEALASLPASRGGAGAIERAAPPVVTSIDGILVVEDSGVILRRDRLFDLPLESIELIPSGAGYQLMAIPSAYEPLGAQDQALFLGQSSWRSEPVTLSGFSFPFGGVGRSQFWVTPTNLVAFAPPVEPVKVGLCHEGCYLDEGQVLLDRTPRLSPLQHGSFFYGLDAFVREESDRVVITWRYSNPANLDVQAVLFSDGRIRFNYAAVSGLPWGAVVVVTGNDALWSDLRLGGDASDPAGDVTIPAPDGPAMDIVSASARQVGSTELLQVELTLAAPPPADEEQRILYVIELRDGGSDEETIGNLLFQWQDGRFYWATEPVKLDGSTLRLNLRLHQLQLRDNDLYLEFSTLRGGPPYENGDTLQLRAVFDQPDGPLMLDLTSDLPVTLGDQPIYEAFTLPSLQTGEVLEAAAPLFEDPTTIEAFPIFQNLWTDIWFFAGGYHAGGNSGADGIGYGSSAMPRSPSLLHLNNIYTYGPEDGAMQVMSHELGHRWLYHFSIEESGQLSRILNPVGSHPAGWVHTPAVRPVYYPLDYSVMGGSNWQDDGRGGFSSPPANLGGGNGFSWHELYLMGLADPVEVSAWWYIANANPPLPSAYWAPNDTTVQGTRVPVKIDQIISAEGARFPAYPNAPQHFLAPIVLVVRPGAYSQDELDTVRDLCNVWQLRFNEATDLRATVRCLFHPPTVAITLPGSDVTVFAGETVDFSGSGADADGDPVELRWSFSGAAADAVGGGPHAVTFDSTGSYPIRLEGVDGSGMLGEQPDTRTVSVQCPSTPPTGSVPDLRLAREAGEIRFSWTDLPDPTLDYVVLSGGAPQGPLYPRADAVSGSPGPLLPEPTGSAYFKVAARNGDGCLGPY